MNPYESPKTGPPPESPRKTSGHLCPHCDKPGISSLRRACLGPAIPAKCRNCGRLVGVPWGRSTLVIVPPVLLAITAHAYFQYPISIHFGILLLLCAALVPLSFWLIPLEKR